MQKNSYLRLALIALALTLSFVVLRSSQRSVATGLCSKNGNECPQKKRQAPSGMFLETVSRQFFTSVVIPYE
jgi:hypothetical protein